MLMNRGSYLANDAEAIAVKCIMSMSLLPYGTILLLLLMAAEVVEAVACEHEIARMSQQEEEGGVG